MSKKSKKPSDNGTGLDLLDKNEEKEKLQPPSKYKIVFYNDDFTPMQYVVIALMQIYNHDQNTATELMLAVHEKGREIVKDGLSKEIADTKVEKTISFFRRLGYPLRCVAEQA